jgi:sulfatase maturation enzyme AslB (radical SAM superfamily)
MPKTNAQSIKEHRETFEGFMIYVVDRWRRRGVVETDYYTFQELFEAWLYAPECENCGVELAPIGVTRCAESRCLDHNHKTGIFRNILCHACNIKRCYYEPD